MPMSRLLCILLMAPTAVLAEHESHAGAGVSDTGGGHREHFNDTLQLTGLVQVAYLAAPPTYLLFQLRLQLRDPLLLEHPRQWNHREEGIPIVALAHGAPHQQSQQPLLQERPAAASSCCPAVAAEPPASFFLKAAAPFTIENPPSVFAVRSPAAASSCFPAVAAEPPVSFLKAAAPFTIENRPSAFAVRSPAAAFRRWRQSHQSPS